MGIYREKSIVYVEFGTICSFRNSLGVLEHMPVHKGRLPSSQVGTGNLNWGGSGPPYRETQLWNSRMFTWRGGGGTSMGQFCPSAGCALSKVLTTGAPIGCEDLPAHRQKNWPNVTEPCVSISGAQ